MIPRRVGLVAVHGVGEQRRRQIADDLARGLLKRGSSRIREANSPEEGDPNADRSLVLETPGGALWLRIYEAYWGGLATDYTRRDALLFYAWLLWTLAYPFANLVGGRYRHRRLSLPVFALSFAALLFTGSLAHLLNAALWILLALPGLGRRRTALRRQILEYGGDVYLYVRRPEASGHFDRLMVSEDRRRIDQAAFRGPFELALALAAGGNDQVQIVGHSLGSVIAYDALTGGTLPEPQLAKITAMHTWGSPLDKFYFVWPDRRRFRIEPPPRTPLRWINWSHGLDPIGSALDSYNGVAGLERPDNRRFWGLETPASAHSSYWGRPETLDSLLDFLARTRESAGAAEHFGLSSPAAPHERQTP
jgi:hypothetical protein